MNISRDVPTKQLILYINKLNNGQVVIKDLDDTHVLVHKDYVAVLKKRVQEFYDNSTTYVHQSKL